MRRLCPYRVTSDRYTISRRPAFTSTVNACNLAGYALQLYELYNLAEFTNETSMSTNPVPTNIRPITM